MMAKYKAKTTTLSCQFVLFFYNHQTQPTQCQKLTLHFSFRGNLEADKSIPHSELENNSAFRINNET